MFVPNTMRQTRVFSQSQIKNWMNFVICTLFLLLPGICLYIESIPSCEGLSVLCIHYSPLHTRVTIPYYMRRCNSEESRESVYDLLGDRDEILSSFSSVSVQCLHHSEPLGRRTCPNVFRLRCYSSSPMRLPLRTPSTTLSTHHVGGVTVIRF